MRLKIYEWEREKFKWHWALEIKPEDRIELTLRLAKEFNLNIGRHMVLLSTYGGARHAWKKINGAKYTTFIKLPISKYDCPLAMILHELAHAYDLKFFNHSGHTGTFKRALIKLNIETESRWERLKV